MISKLLDAHVDPDHSRYWNKGSRTADYPLQIDMHPQFSDVDMHCHLNNVAQARFYEEGVARFHRTVLDGLWSEGTPVIGEIRIRYLAEGTYPGPLTLYGGVSHVGSSSYTIEQTLWQAGGQLSICQTTNVYRKQGASSPLPDALRALLRKNLVRCLPNHC